MKKLLCTLAATAALLQAGAAKADVTVHLDEAFMSGAVFSGNVTFSDGYDALIGVTGSLSGGSYGSDSINWTWWIGTGQGSYGRDWDGNASTHEDWIMNGTPSSWSVYIGLSWTPTTSGPLMLSLVPDVAVYHAGINDMDATVSYSVTAVPEPSTYAMLLAGLGLTGALARRRRQ